MNNLTSEKFPYSKKELECLKELSKMRDEDIDFSDIPEITPEEWRKNFKPARLRQKNVKIAS